MRIMRDLQILDNARKESHSHANPLVRFGRKCYSQSDEDGITLEIVRRLGLSSGGIYGEFGVGNGTENNTLVLGALGWRGFWVGGEELAFDPAAVPAKRFSYQKQWITLDNVAELARNGLQALEASEPDVLSLDLDGNDLYLVNRLLESGVVPKLFIVEYNAKFPPPIRFSVAYSPSHRWANDDYFGASLMSFVDVFARHGFGLICCNAASGSNAFFVKRDLLSLFPEVPADVLHIYSEPRYYHYQRYGHRMTTKTILRLLSGADANAAPNRSGVP
jgi:hypothetical protein